MNSMKTQLRSSQMTLPFCNLVRLEQAQRIYLKGRVQLFFLSIKSHILVASAEQVDLEKYSPVCVEPEDQTGTSSGQVIGEQLL